MVGRIGSWLLVIGLTAAAASGDVLAPRVTTDQSVDTHSLQAIVRSVCRPGMTEEQKAVALYEFTRRVMFHFEQRGEKGDQAFDLDALRLINTYGYSFCTQQMCVLTSLWQAAGIQGRILSVPGHSTASAHYGGKDHWFDPLIGAYVLSAKGGPVASLREIADDPAVLTRAAEQGRASPTFMPCGRVLAEDSARFVLDNPEYVKSCQDLKDDTNYMAVNAPKAKAIGGPRKTLYQGDFALRAGERVSFLWDGIDGEYNIKAGIPAAQLPPNHFCGVEADRKDPLNYPFWKPYEKVVNGVAVCRYHANGRHSLAPRFTNEYFKRGVAANSFAWFGFGSGGPPYLRPAKPGQPANIVYRMSTPHVYTSAMLSAEFVRGDPADVSRLYASGDAGVTWVKVWDAAEPGPADKTGTVAASVDLRKIVHGRREFYVRAECATAGETAGCGLNKLGVEAVFQHNMFARPFLGPGKNTVTVRVANPETLAFDRFEVAYVWQQDGQTGRDARRITESPAQYVIDVPGERMPRMVSLDLSVAP